MKKKYFTDQERKDGKNALQRQHRRNNPDYYRNVELKKDFGLTLVEYEKLLVAQNGLCAICEQPETSMRGGKLKRLAVDHDHETGELRGLLCSNCNPLLGYAKEDVTRLKAAVRYLERHSGKSNVVPLKIVKETA